MKRWWDSILQKFLSISRALTLGYRLISPAWLTNQITGLARIFHSSKILHYIYSKWKKYYIICIPMEKNYNIYSWWNKQYRIFDPQGRNTMELFIITDLKEQITGRTNMFTIQYVHTSHVQQCMYCQKEPPPPKKKYLKFYTVQPV